MGVQVSRMRGNRGTELVKYDTEKQDADRERERWRETERPTDR